MMLHHTPEKELGYKPPRKGRIWKVKTRNDHSEDPRIKQKSEIRKVCREDAEKNNPSHRRHTLLVSLGELWKFVGN